jgi:hypothetical protein
MMAPDQTRDQTQAPDLAAGVYGDGALNPGIKTSTLEYVLTMIAKEVDVRS